MVEQCEKVQNRRQLFSSVLRYAALGVLGVVGGFLVAKRLRLVKSGICINSEICGSCGIFEECGLPAALSAKANFTESK